MAPLFKDKICAVVAAPDWRRMNDLLLRAVAYTGTVEFRLDWLRAFREQMRCLPEVNDGRFNLTGQGAPTYKLRKLYDADERRDWVPGVKDYFPKLPRHGFGLIRIATCRHQRAGGSFRGKWTSQLSMLQHALVDHAEWCDFDIELAERFSPDDLERRLRPELTLMQDAGFVQMIRAAGIRLKTDPPELLVSYHNFGQTPASLGRIVRRLDQYRGKAVKIATQCNSYSDALRVLALCKGRRDVIAVPMGEIGLPARVLALAHGSALAYAAVGEKTAPGQLTLDEMKNLYRADKLDRKTKVYGVIGNPVSHSLSPLMHNTGFIARKLNAVYLPFLVKDLRDFLGAIKPLNIAGFSATLPWKERILRHLDDCDPLAEKIGAVNTVVVRRNGKLYACNTDYVGVLRALERRVRLRGSRVLLYGAGGVARAVAFALAQGGAIVCVCSRRTEQARQLARAVGGIVVERLQLRREFFDAIVNCTPVGMRPRTNASPLRADELNCRLVFDTIYRPMRTRLLQLAERRGIETVSGVEMFIAQGVAQWEIWTESRAPEAAMRKAVLAALRRDES